MSACEAKKRVIFNDPGIKVAYQQRNPKAANSAAYRRYEQYKHASTVGEAFDAGATSMDINHDYRRGYLEVKAGNGLDLVLDLLEINPDRRRRESASLMSFPTKNGRRRTRSH